MTGLTLAETLFQRAVAAQAAADFATAEQTYRQALIAAPEMIAIRHNLGALLRGLGRLEEARGLFQSVLDQDPAQAASRHALGMVLLALGDYPAGWPCYEARRDVPALKTPAPVLPFPEWQGEDLAGRRIVIFPEQGLGDNLQFARFALTLRDRGAQVLLLSRPALAPLLSDSLEGIEIIPAQGAVDLGEPDVWALAGSLPGRLRMTLDALPAQPYLRSAGARRLRTTGRLRVGLAHRGNPLHPNDAYRSLGPAETARLQRLPCEIVSLLPEDSGDFVQTAAVIADLDLVISVDTSLLHLAGALGAPALALLPGFATDWRWLRDRSDSPWYPSLTLYRGSVDGGWSKALDQVEARVDELTAGPPPPT